MYILDWCGSAYCQDLAWRGALLWNGCVFGVDVWRPVVWSIAKPHGAVPPRLRGAQIVLVKTSGEEVCLGI